MSLYLCWHARGDPRSRDVTAGFEKFLRRVLHSFCDTAPSDNTPSFHRIVFEIVLCSESMLARVYYPFFCEQVAA